MPFNSNARDTFSFDNIDLKHVPNVAILLNDSRHFVVSKKHPNSKEVFKALKVGLSKLRQQKHIETAYKQAGFIIDLSKYKVLNATN